VVVDGIYKADKDGKKVYMARSANELKDIENAVKQAVGFNADREDLISVSCMQFAQEDTGPQPGAVTRFKDLILENLGTMFKWLVLLVVIVLVLVLVIRPLMKWLTSGVRIVSETAADQRAIGSEERRALESSGKELPMLEEAMAKSEEMKTAITGQRKVIQEIAKADNESATAVVKSWLQEQGS